MKKSLYIIGVILFSLTVLSLTTQTLWAKYPEKPITIIMAWPPGGSMDLTMRPLTQAASKNIGQPMTIEYRAGASGAVGVAFLKNKKPDGYTIGTTSDGSITQQYIAKVDYDMMQDFTQIMQYVEVVQGLVVRADSPWKTFQELVDYAKANPGKIRYSTASPAGPPALTMASLSKRFGIDWSIIPFAGGAPAVTALMGGHVEAFAATLGGARAHILSGRLRLLAAFGERRSPSFPDVPHLTELGYPVNFPISYWIFGPKGLSAEILETLHQAFKKGLQDQDFIKACSMGESIITYRNPRETTEYLHKLSQETKQIVRVLNMNKE